MFFLVLEIYSELLDPAETVQLQQTVCLHLLEQLDFISDRYQPGIYLKPETFKWLQTCFVIANVINLNVFLA